MIESSMLNKLITFDLLSIIPNERDFRIISGSEYFKDYDNSIFITLKPNSFVNLNYVNKGKVEYIALYCKDFYLKIDLDSTNIMSTCIDEEKSPFSTYDEGINKIMVFANSIDYSITLEKWSPLCLKTYNLSDSFATKFVNHHQFVFSFKTSDIKSKELCCSMLCIDDVLDNLLKFASDLKDNRLKMPQKNNQIRP